MLIVISYAHYDHEVRHMKVVGYIRVSTDGQEASGLGLDAQREKIMGYCSLYDLELVDLVQDTASGKATAGYGSEFFHVIAKTSAGASERIGGTDNYGEAQINSNVLRFFNAIRV